MYEIFIHVSSITILEICFFFFYIGPLETDIFYNYIKRLLNTPLNTLQESLNQWGMTRQQFIEGIISIDDNTDVEHQLYLASQEGKHERIKGNNKLFSSTLEFWSILVFLSIFVFGIEFLYKRIRNKSKRHQHQILSDEFVVNEDNVELQNYRKNSTDEVDLEAELQQIEKTKRIKTLLKIAFEYSIYGGCIIGFQYLFFNYVVFEYKPLSTEEMEYYIYMEFVNYE
tara:strand:- start:1730 stop:2410 length:681 start_codon:yes stop_codon:yes gene_type:complete